LINPIWKEVAGGCNLNRNIPQIIKDSGFKNIKLETMYIPGWKPLSYNYWELRANKSVNFTVKIVI
jgi:hypothetical protein